MQPESFPTDDSLGRSVQPASAPLSAKEGAFGEENAPYEAVFGDVSKIIDAARESAVRSVNAAMTAAYWLIGRRIVEFEQSGGRAGRVRSRAHRETGGGLDRTVRPRLLPSERPEHAPVLPLIPNREDSPDTVWQIACIPSMADSPDAVWHIRSRFHRAGLRRPSRGLSAALVSLRAAAVGQE